MSWALAGTLVLILAVAGGTYGGEARLLEGVDNGYGDHYNETWSQLPLGIYANVP